MASRPSRRPGPARSKPRYLNPTEVAELLEVSRKTVSLWLTENKIPYWRVAGGTYRIPLDRLLASLDGNYDFKPELERAAEALCTSQVADEPTGD